MPGRELMGQDPATWRPKYTNPGILVDEAKNTSGQDGRDQEDKGLLDEINDAILGVEERGREETDRSRYGYADGRLQR